MGACPRCLKSDFISRKKDNSADDETFSADTPSPDAQSMMGKGKMIGGSSRIAEINQAKIKYNKRDSLAVADMLEGIRSVTYPMLRYLEKNKDAINDLPVEAQSKAVSELVFFITDMFDLTDESREKISFLSVYMLNSFMKNIGVFSAVVKDKKSLSLKDGVYEVSREDKGLSFRKEIDRDAFGEFIYKSKAGTYEEDNAGETEDSGEEARVDDDGNTTQLDDDEDNAQFRSAENAIRDIINNTIFNTFLLRAKFALTTLNKSGTLSISKINSIKELIVGMFADPRIQQTFFEILTNEETYVNWANPDSLDKRSSELQDRMNKLYKRKVRSRTVADIVRMSFAGLSYEDAVAVVSYAQSIPVSKVISPRYHETSKSNNRYNLNLMNLSGSIGDFEIGLYKELVGLAEGTTIGDVKAALAGIPEYKTLEGFREKEDGTAPTQEENKKNSQWIGEWHERLDDKQKTDLNNRIANVLGIEPERLNCWASRQKTAYDIFVKGIIRSAYIYNSEDTLKWMDTVIEKSMSTQDTAEKRTLGSRLAEADMEYAGELSFMFTDREGHMVPAGMKLMGLRDNFVDYVPGKTEADFAVIGGLLSSDSNEATATVQRTDLERVALDLFNNPVETTGSEDAYWFIGIPVGDKDITPAYRMDKHEKGDLTGENGLYKKLYDERLAAAEKDGQEAADKFRKAYMSPEQFDAYVESNEVKNATEFSGNGKKLENFDEFVANFAYNRLFLDPFLLGSPADYKDQGDLSKRSSNLGTRFVRGVLDIEGGLASKGKALVVNIPLVSEGMDHLKPGDTNPVQFVTDDDGAEYTTPTQMKRYKVSYGTILSRDEPTQLKNSLSYTQRNKNGNFHRINIKGLLNSARRGQVSEEVASLAEAIDEYNRDKSPKDQIQIFTDTNATKELYSKSHAVDIYEVVDGRRVLRMDMVQRLLEGKLDDHLLEIDNHYGGFTNQQDYNTRPHTRNVIKQYFSVLAIPDTNNRIAGLSAEILLQETDFFREQDETYYRLINTMYKHNPRVARMISSGISFDNPMISRYVYEMLGGVIRKEMKIKAEGLLTSETAKGDENLKSYEIKEDTEGTRYTALPEIAISAVGLRANSYYSSFDEAYNEVMQNKEMYVEFFPFVDGEVDFEDDTILRRSITEKVINGKTVFVLPGEIASMNRHPATVGSSCCACTIKSILKTEDGEVKGTMCAIPLELALLRGSDKGGDWDNIYVLGRFTDGKVVLFSKENESRLFEFAKKNLYATHKETIERININETSCSPRAAYLAALRSLRNKILLEQVALTRDTANYAFFTEQVDPTRFKHIAKRIRKHGNRVAAFSYDTIRNEENDRYYNTFGAYLYNSFRSGITGTKKVGHALKTVMSYVYAFHDYTEKLPFVTMLETKEYSNTDSELPYNIIMRREPSDEPSYRNSVKRVAKAMHDITNALLDDSKHDQALDLALDNVAMIHTLLANNPMLGLNKHRELAASSEIDENIDSYMEDIVNFMYSYVFVEYRKAMIVEEGVLEQSGTLFLYNNPLSGACGLIETNPLKLYKRVIAIDPGACSNYKEHRYIAKSKKQKAYAKTVSRFYRARLEGNAPSIQPKESLIKELEALGSMMEISSSFTSPAFLQEIYDKRITTPYDLMEMSRDVENKLMSPPDGNNDFNFRFDVNPHYERAKIAYKYYNDSTPESPMYGNDNIKDLYIYSTGLYRNSLRANEYRKIISASASSAIRILAMKQFGADAGQLYADLWNVLVNSRLTGNELIAATTMFLKNTDVEGEVRLQKVYASNMPEGKLERLRMAAKELHSKENLGGKYIKTGSDLLLALMVCSPQTVDILSSHMTFGLGTFMPVEFLHDVIDNFHNQFVEGMKQPEHFMGSRSMYAQLRGLTAKAYNRRNIALSERAVVNNISDSFYGAFIVDSLLSHAGQAIIGEANNDKSSDRYTDELIRLYGAAANPGPTASKEISKNVFLAFPMSAGPKKKAQFLACAESAGMRMAVAVANGRNILINNYALTAHIQAGNTDVLNALWRGFKYQLEKKGVIPSSMPRTDDFIAALTELVGKDIVVVKDINADERRRAQKSAYMIFYGSRFMPPRVAESTDIAVDAVPVEDKKA